MKKIKGLGCIKILNLCIFWKDTTKYRLYYSERNNKDGGFYIGKYRIVIKKLNKILSCD